MGRRGNNEGSISKRPDGRWMVQVTMPDGTRKTTYAKTRAEVVEKRKELLKDAEQAGRMIPGRSYGSIGDFLEVWVVNVAPSVKPNTAKFYADYVRRYTADLAALTPAQLKPQHLTQLYAKLLKQGLSSTTVRHLHAVLHRALDNAVKQGIYSQNYCDLVDAPRTLHKEMQTFSAEQTRTFLETIRGVRFEALFALAVSTGMRQGELLGLTWENVDIDRGMIYVKNNLQFIKGEVFLQDPKTDKSRRMIFVGPLVRELLAAHKERQQEERLVLAQDRKWNLVFTTLKGHPVHPSTLVHEHYYPILKRAKLPHIRFHDLRHTAATLLLEAGINPKVVSEMLGHSSVGITLSLYAHATPAMHYTASVIMDKVLRGEINPLALPEGIG
jgi:integrase